MSKAAEYPRESSMRMSVAAAIAYAVLVSLLCIWFFLTWKWPILGEPAGDETPAMILKPRIAGLSLYQILLVTNVLWLGWLLIDGVGQWMERRKLTRNQWVSLFLAVLLIVAVQLATIAMKSVADSLGS